jgi:hypothetical protein
MNDLYIRKTELLFGNKILDGERFTIYFEIPFDDTNDPNVGTIEVYNLKDSTITQLKKDTEISLNAGYVDNFGTIFLGTIQQPQTSWQNVDKITSLDCIDSGETWFKKEVNKTYKGGIKAQQVLNDLLKLTGLSVGALKLPINKTYKGGKTIKSTLSEAISLIAQDCGAKLHVNKRKVFIRPKNDGDNIHFVVNKGHGLIGMPTQVEKEIVTGKDKEGNEIKTKVNGWKVVSLLNHRITTDAILEISSKTANGVFRVDNGKHVCNGNNFYTEMEVYPL